MAKFKVYEIVCNSKGDMLNICSSLFKDVAFIDNKIYVVSNKDADTIKKKITPLYTVGFGIVKIDNYSAELRDFVESKIINDCIQKTRKYTGEIEKHRMNRNNTIFEIIKNLREQEEEIISKNSKEKKDDK